MKANSESGHDGASVASGVGWTALGRGARVLVQLLSTVVLMRLLDPADFGVITIAAVLMGAADVLADVGLSSGLVHARSTTEVQDSSIFWLNLAGSVCVAAAFYSAAPALAVFFAHRGLVDVIAVTGVTFVIASLGLVPRALLTRRMRFDLLARIELLSLVAGLPVAFALAAHGFGYWALVLQVLTQTSVTTAVCWTVQGFRPRWRFSLAETKSLIRYGLDSSAYAVVQFSARRADEFLVGRVMGTAALGFYSRGFNLMLNTVHHLSAIVSRVLFPHLASIRSDRARVRETFVRALALKTLVAFPMVIGLAAVSDALVEVLFGARWAPVARLFQILWVAGISQSVTHLVPPLLQALGEARLMLRWGVLSAMLQLVAIAIGMLLGSIEWLACTYSVAHLLLLLPTLALAGNRVRAPLWTLLGSFAPQLAIALTMGVLVLTVEELVPGAPREPRLLLQLGVGAAAYAGLLALFRPLGARELLRFWRRFRP